ncbi:mucin-2-like [Zootermopsis nevadensis]|nr:mucin-2-like [Zootermopsis nevadensis]
MPFYPPRRDSGPELTSRPPERGEAGVTMHLNWLIKSFLIGLMLLGLSFWLVQTAGIQYLATLTSAVLIAFLFAYVVWCLMHKGRHSRQRTDRASQIEAGHNPPLHLTAEPQTATPPPPFDHHQSYKFLTAIPARGVSPPPSYEEAIRAMVSMSTSTPGLGLHTPVSPTPTTNSTPPISAISLTQLYSTIVLQSPQPLAVSASSQSALTSPLTPLRLCSTPETVPVPETLTASGQNEPVSTTKRLPQSTVTHQPSTDLT